MEPATFRINVLCQFPNTDLESIPVKVQNEEDFRLAQLDKAICELLSNSQYVQRTGPATKRELYTAPQERDIDDLETPVDISGLRRLGLAQRLDKLNRSSDQHIHCVVVVTNLLTPSQQAHMAMPDIVKTMQKLQIATQSPSSFQPPKVRKMQEDPQMRILNDRPSFDSAIAPLGLLYDGFGLFEDIFWRQELGPNAAIIDEVKLEDAVDSFCEAMRPMFDEEYARWVEAIPLLNAIFQAKVGTPLEKLRPHSDGHEDGLHFVTTSTLEIKSEKGGILNAMPDIEGLAYVARSNAHAATKHPDLFAKYGIPSMLITMTGPELQIYAALLLGTRYRFLPLTPSLSLVFSAGDIHFRRLVVWAFKAAIVLRSRIEDDIKSALDRAQASHCPLHSNAWFLPNVSSVQMLDLSSRIDFQIDQLYDDSSNRFLYHATTFDGEQILVKFTRSYSRDLHVFCHSKGHAPALLGLEKLPGGWLVIAMELIGNAYSLANAPDFIDRATIAKLGSQAEALVHAFHKQNLVHGDLRTANFLVVNSDDTDTPLKLILIDYDWGGEVGLVSYPTRNLNPELGILSNRSSLITKEDDLRVVREGFAGLMQKARAPGGGMMVQDSSDESD